MFAVSIYLFVIRFCMQILAFITHQAAITSIGAPDRVRTCDLRLRKPTLYPLSYRCIIKFPINNI